MTDHPRFPELRGPACHRASRLSRRTAGRSRLPAGRLVVAGDAWRPTAGWHTPGCQAHDRCAGAAAGCSASELPATRRRTARMTARRRSRRIRHTASRPRALRLALHVRQFQGILRLRPAFQRRSARRCVYRYFGRSPRPLGISAGFGLMSNFARNEYGLGKAVTFNVITPMSRAGTRHRQGAADDLRPAQADSEDRQGALVPAVRALGGDQARRVPPPRARAAQRGAQLRLPVLPQHLQRSVGTLHRCLRRRAVRAARRRLVLEPRVSVCAAGLAPESLHRPQPGRVGSRLQRLSRRLRARRARRARASTSSSTISPSRPRTWSEAQFDREYNRLLIRTQNMLGTFGTHPETD